MKLKTGIIVALIGISVLLTGCNLEYGDGLLAVPRLPDEYKGLQDVLDSIMADSAAYYVSADEGSRQPVQLVDLDADGEDEVVAFFRKSDGNILAYVFKNRDGEYAVAGIAEGYGRSLRSVYYATISQSGRQALAVTWGLDAGAAGFGLTVFALEDEGLYTMLDVQCSKMTIEDVTGDSLDDIVIVQRETSSDLTETFSALIYGAQDGEYRNLFKVNLSREVRSVSNITFGRMSDRQKALFIDSLALEGGYITDVISIDGSQAVNQTMDPASREGLITWRAVSVFSSDISGDGVIDIPVTKLATSSDKGDIPNKLYWKNFENGAEALEVGVTYHNTQEKWYINWPDIWDTDVQAETTSSAYMTRTRFFVQSGLLDQETGEEVQMVLLNIFVFSGDNRSENYKMFSNVKPLKTTSSEIYGYSLPSEEPAGFALTPERVEAMFHTIDTSWYG